MNAADIAVLEWHHYQALPPERKKSTFDRCLVTRKPLYGGSDAPLRWYLRVSASLMMDGWSQARSDVCAITRYRKNEVGNAVQISSVIILHVDDLLIAADTSDMGEFDRVMAQFRTGAREDVEMNIPVAYISIEILRGADGNYGLRQQKYINELQLIRREDVWRQNSMVISKDRWGTLTRQAIGRLIWSCQTRFDGSAVVSFLITSAVCVWGGPDGSEFGE